MCACMSVCACACACVCVCVSEGVCVCVYACERECGLELGEKDTMHPRVCHCSDVALAGHGEDGRPVLR